MIHLSVSLVSSKSEQHRNRSESQMASGHEFDPRILGFLCNWCCYAGADLAGVSRYQYAPNIRIIRLMCSGRVDPAFVIRAFARGHDGVFIGGCWLGECHYVTEGNYDALSMMHLTRKILAHIGVEPERLRLEWVSASEGIRFAEVMNSFTEKLKTLGPLGKSEGLDRDILKTKLEAASRIVPYLKLVEREKLRVRFKTEEEYDEYFNSDEVNQIFHDLIEDRLTASEILLLLAQGNLSTGEISKALELSPSDVSRHINACLSEGLVRYDAGQKKYILP